MGALDRLIKEIDNKTCPIVVGLDPVIKNIPLFIKERAIKEYGNTVKGAAESLYDFNSGLIEVLYPWIPAVKLQMACYELYGSFGIDVYERTLTLAKEKGLLLINDSKRNDIGSSAELYAAGHLGRTPLIKGDKASVRADFMTVNPYLGSDGILPFVKECAKHEKGIFILVRTSNPSGKEYQEATINETPLFKKIAEDVDKMGRDLIDGCGYSAVGAVVGATWPKQAAELREIMPAAYFLVPGYGAQGATAEQVTSSFDRNGYGALINSSRSVIYAYQNPKLRMNFKDDAEYAEMAVAAVKEMKADILSALSRAGKLPSNW